MVEYQESIVRKLFAIGKVEPYLMLFSLLFRINSTGAPTPVDEPILTLVGLKKKAPVI